MYIVLRLCKNGQMPSHQAAILSHCLRCLLPQAFAVLIQAVAFLGSDAFQRPTPPSPHKGPKKDAMRIFESALCLDTRNRLPRSSRRGEASWLCRCRGSQHHISVTGRAFHLANHLGLGFLSFGRTCSRIFCLLRLLEKRKKASIALREFKTSD